MKHFNCGKTGHKKQECYKEVGGSYDPKKARGKKITEDKDDNKNANKVAPCLLCWKTGGKIGHKAVQCKEKMKFAGPCTEVTNTSRGSQY
jgi:hypothetical protein